MSKGDSSTIYRIKRVIRIIRFLYHRGTLFRAKRKPVPAPLPKSKKRKKNQTWRKLRYLIRKGSFFKLFKPRPRKKKAAYTPFPVKKHFNPYLAYRQLRFLVKTGRIFKRKKERNPNRNLRRRRTFRILRYLIIRRRLIAVNRKKMIKKALPSYRFLLDRKYIVILINSTAVFLIAYLFTFLVTSFSTVVAASSFNIKTIVNLERVEFLIRSKDWTMDAIRVVYSTGPFISFLLALLFLVIYSRIVIHEWFGRLFLLWFFVLLFCRFFGELFIGSLLMKGIGYTIVYMYYKDTSKMLVIMTSAFIQIMAGFLMTRYFIFSGNIYFNEINSGNRRAFILSQAFIPFILGNILLIVIKSPKITGFEILINASLFLFILPVLIRSRYLDNIYFTEGEKRVRIQWITIALSIILLILYRIVFAMGFRPDFHLS